MTASEIKKVTTELHKVYHPTNTNMPLTVANLQASWEIAYQLAVMNEKGKRVHGPL